MTISKKSHATCSASGASRWLACPGSVWASSQVEYEKPSPYAEEGTRAHELAEEFLLQCMQNSFEPPDWWTDAVKANYEEEMIQSCIMYVDKVLFEIKQFDALPSIRIESKLTLNDEMRLFGTADVAITGHKGGEEVGVILDLKYGKTKVVAEENPQLAYYACAMKNTSKKRLKKIKVIIVQPRIKNPITEVEYTEMDLAVWHDKLIRGAEKAYLQILSEDKVFIPGSHCKWCRGLPVCPEKNKMPASEEGLEFIND